MTITLGISSCLLGNSVRYDGNHKQDYFLTGTLGTYVTWVPVCPEVECGLPIPREAMRLVAPKGGEPKLVTINSGIDHTTRMQRWIESRLKDLDGAGLCGFIFKSRSPSSALTDAKVYLPGGGLVGKGPGLFAGAFVKRFPLVPVIDEGRLHDPGLRENFIERIFVYARWQELLSQPVSGGRLVEFHATHKLLVMAHNPQAVARLGAVVSRCGKRPSASILQEYFGLLMETLALIATVKKQTNVLQHMAGYFKKQLSADQKQELQEVISAYHCGLVPLLVPLTLISHYVRLYNESYLKNQVYLNPHPLELMLRNHV